MITTSNSSGKAAKKLEMNTEQLKKKIAAARLAYAEAVSSMPLFGDEDTKMMNACDKALYELERLRLTLAVREAASAIKQLQIYSRE